jgi:hypothetical protein
MGNPKIKFSHTYTKLAGKEGKPVTHAMLIAALSIHMDQLTKEFYDYDTDNGKYNLKFDSLYMMLIFKKPLGDLFTTLRPQYNRMQGDKLPYYRGLIGQVFEIVITEEVPPVQNRIQTPNPR